MLSVHLDGGFYLPTGLQRDARQKYGRTVIISSAGNFGQPMEAHYAAAKTGLVGLSNVIAIEGADMQLSSIPFCRAVSRGW